MIGSQYHSLVETKMTFTSYYDPTSATAAAIAGAIEGSIGLNYVDASTPKLGEWAERWDSRFDP